MFEDYNVLDPTTHRTPGWVASTAFVVIESRRITFGVKSAGRLLRARETPCLLRRGRVRDRKLEKSHERAKRHTHWTVLAAVTIALPSAYGCGCCFL